MSFIVYAWLGSLFSALIVIVSKLTSKYSIKNPWLFNFLWIGFTTVFLVPIAISQGVSYPDSWLFIIASALSAFLFTIFYIASLYYLDVTVISPLFNLRTAFAVLLGMFILKEVVTSYQLFLIAIIFISSFFVTLDERFSLKSLNKGIIFFLISMFALALTGMFTNLAISSNNYWTATFYTQIGMMVILMGTTPLFYKEIKQLRKQQILVMALIGLLELLTILCINAAVAENVSISSTIISLPLSMVLAIGLSIFWPRLLEDHSWRVYTIRIIATIIMFASALQL